MVPLGGLGQGVTGPLHAGEPEDFKKPTKVGLREASIENNHVFFLSNG
jgi:hypothetical protein